MSTVALVEEFEATAEVAAIFADIRATFGMPSVPAMFRAIAHHPGYLKASWERVKVIMAPGLIDLRVRTGEPGAETKETLASAAKALWRI